MNMCSVAGDFLKKKDSKITLGSACWRTHETAMEATGVQVDDTMTGGGCKPSCHLGGSESFHHALFPLNFHLIYNIEGEDKATDSQGFLNVRRYAMGEIVDDIRDK